MLPGDWLSSPQTPRLKGCNLLLMNVVCQEDVRLPCRSGHGRSHRWRPLLRQSLHPPFVSSRGRLIRRERRQALSNCGRQESAGKEPPFLSSLLKVDAQTERRWVGCASFRCASRQRVTATRHMHATGRRAFRVLETLHFVLPRPEDSCEDRAGRSGTGCRSAWRAFSQCLQANLGMRAPA